MIRFLWRLWRIHQRGAGSLLQRIARARAAPSWQRESSIRWSGFRLTQTLKRGRDWALDCAPFRSLLSEPFSWRTFRALLEPPRRWTTDETGAVGDRIRPERGSRTADRNAFAPYVTDCLPYGTYNAAWFPGATKEAQINACIIAVGADPLGVACWLNSSMIPFNAALVTFNNVVRMFREGGNLQDFDVRAYGAAGNGATNDLASFNAAINGCSASDFAIGGAVVVPSGRYIVNGPVIMKNNIALVGVGSRICWGWDANTGPFLPSMIAANPATWIANDPVIDNRGTTVTRIEALHVQGTGTVNADQTNATSVGIMYGTANQADSGGLNARHVLAECNVVGHKSGVWLKEANLFTGRENNVAGNWNAGMLFDKFCGDFTLIGNYIDRNQELSTSDATPPTGAGLYFGPGSWNGDIIGGKIENNATGIFFTEAGGINVVGTVFHANSRRAIWLNGGPTYPTTSIVVTGCRLFTNGYNNVGGQSCHIQLSAGLAGQRVGITVSGCSIKRGNNPTSSVDYPSSGVIGPDYAVLARVAGLMNVTVVGNDMDDSCNNQATGAFRIEAAVDTGSIFLLGPNLGNPVQQILNGGTPTPKPAQVLFSGAQASTASTSDVSLRSFPVPAGLLAVNGQELRVRYRGHVSTQAASVNLKYGASVVQTVAVAANGDFEISVSIMRTGAATQTITTKSLTGTTVAIASLNGAETLANAITVDFRGSVTAGGTLFLNEATVEAIIP